ncbi:MAG: ATP-grasp domain-containing protein [Cyclobacteriaceae bacterium]|nr:ATP-grasp domain-containing protein [Cyclobacteriaceae bacterium]
MDKPKYTIAVTGINAIDNPGSGVGVIRSIRECEDFDVRIIGLAYESMEPGAYLHDIIDKTYQIPYPSAGSERLKERLLFIHSVEKLDLIIPNFDAELGNFIRISALLKRSGIQTFLPTIDAMERIDKMHLTKFCDQNDFKTPKTKFINNIDEIDSIEDEFDYPVYVKGAFYEAYKAQNKGQIIANFYKLSAKWGLPVIIQEAVEGTEVVIAGMGDGKGNLIGAIPLRKLFITNSGKGWSGVVLEDESLIAVAEKFARVSKWKGGFELEFVRTEDYELKFLEVNPRFPAWIYTSVAAGQNMPAALVKLSMGQEVSPFTSYIPGKMFVRYAWELVTDIKEFQKLSTQGEL